MARLLFDDFKGGFENGPWWQRLLNGYSITTWLVVLNLGSTGLLVSWLMKYADNIVKVILVQSLPDEDSFSSIFSLCSFLSQGYPLR